jgi:non-haem Fe2+, alpha-ketoglutarate-dependent halogenase
MNDLKQKFFEEGFIYPLKAMETSQADTIRKEYIGFYEGINSESEKIEHKTKSHLIFNWANKIIFNKNILDVVKNIIGENIVAWNSLIFLKPPNSKKFVSYHQDQNYWKIKMDKGLTVQVALSQSSIQNGCLQILPKSHKKNYNHFDKKDTNNLLARGQEVILSSEENKGLKNIILNPGEFCAFHGNIVHGSQVNSSDDYRFLFSIRYLTPDNQIDERLYYNYSTLVNGKDDFNYFQKEPNMINDTVNECKNFHKKLITRQAKIYAGLYLKKLSFLSFLMEFKFIRNIVYKLRQVNGQK